jgi:hypothetical protein
VSRILAGAACVTMLLIVVTAAAARTTPNRAYPDTADHNTLFTLRDGVRQDAQTMLATITRCEQRARTPYGAGRDAFNHCITTLLSRDLYKSRFETVMLVGVLRDLARGPCAGLAAGLADAISSLGSESETWFGDAENPDPSGAALEKADAHDMRAIARSAISLTSSRKWRSACRARPYDPSEKHPVRAGARARAPAARHTLVLPWPASGSLALVA